jgi:membrane protein implicated in regulation of membrane protease activity
MEINFIMGSVPLTWFVVGLFILVLEFVVPGFVIFFFGVGAWIVALTTLFFDIPANFQLLEFIATSVLSLYFLRNIFTNLFSGSVKSKQSIDDEMDNYIGAKVVVTQKITPSFKGRVEFHGTSWNAVSDIEIEVGEIVEVIGKDNLTLIVKK